MQHVLQEPLLVQHVTIPATKANLIQVALPPVKQQQAEQAVQAAVVAETQKTQQTVL